MDEHTLNLSIRESKAWQNTNTALRTASKGGSWNDDKWSDLHDAIVHWAETLVLLRIEQDSVTRAKEEENQ